MFGRHYFGARQFGPRYFGDGGDVAPPVVVTQQNSGGYWHTPDDRPRERVIPKRVKKVIQAVAKATVAQEKTDGQAEAILASRLAQQDIEVQARYAVAMQQERDRILTRDITRALAIRRRQQEMDDEDEREVHMLLM